MNGQSSSEKGYEQCFMFDVKGYVEIDIANTFNILQTTMAMSTTMAAHIGTSCKSWSFLTPAVFKLLNRDLTLGTWSESNERLFLKEDLEVSAKVDSEDEQFRALDPFFDQVSYNGCLSRSTINLNYDIKFHFLPGKQTAKSIYLDHGWGPLTLNWLDKLQSTGLSRILRYHQMLHSFNDEVGWKIAYEDAQQWIF